MSQQRRIGRHAEPVMPLIHVLQAAEHGRQTRLAQDQEKAGEERAATDPPQHDANLPGRLSPCGIGPDHEPQDESERQNWNRDFG
ncbi:hypothetical protein M2323_001623 [Rhodoblastus acidophilus]|nr:hypothetical protein [Rhodoblastus acidophilus]MCW2284010.1 hypothetical protein [Rhodoblastus acidophilus]MCW2332706.1 hypothetical protein [Rhodoblastus acidophilus]